MGELALRKRRGCSAFRQTRSEEELKKGIFSMDSYLAQLRQMKKMGGMEGVMSMLPGVNKMKDKMDKANIDERMLLENEAIILSMTKKEKEVNPLWGGRFTKGTGDLAQSFSASVDVDKNLFEVDIKGSIAYAEILKAAKILTAKDLAKIKKGRVLVLQKCDGVWCKIKTKDFKGWIKTDNIWGTIN